MKAAAISHKHGPSYRSRLIVQPLLQLTRNYAGVLVRTLHELGGDDADDPELAHRLRKIAEEMERLLRYLEE